MRSAVLILLFLSSCATAPPRRLDPAQLVFPYGPYRHQVKLHIPKGEDGQPKDFAFTSVVETSEEKLQLVALTPFNTTLMKIVETRASGGVKIETYEEHLQAHQAELKQFYP